MVENLILFFMKLKFTGGYISIFRVFLCSWMSCQKLFQELLRQPQNLISFKSLNTTKKKEKPNISKTKMNGIAQANTNYHLFFII